MHLPSRLFNIEFISMIKPLREIADLDADLVHA